MKNLTKAVADGAADLIDKCSTATSRAGHVLERVAKLRRGGVSPAVTALQMTETDPAGQTFEAADIESYVKLFRSAESGTPLSAKRTTALLRDAKVHGRAQDAQDSGRDEGPAGAAPAGT